MMTTSEIVEELGVERRRVQYQLMVLRDRRAIKYEKIGLMYRYPNKVLNIVAEALARQDEKRKIGGR